MNNKFVKWLVLSLGIVIIYALSYLVSLPMLSYLDTYRVLSKCGNSITVVSLNGSGKDTVLTWQISPYSDIRRGNTINGWLLVFNDDEAVVNVATYTDDNDPYMTK